MKNREEREQKRVAERTKALFDDYNNRPSADSMKKVLKHPVSIILMASVGAYVALYGASYMLDALTRANTSFQKFKLSLNG